MNRAARGGWAPLARSPSARAAPRVYLDGSFVTTRCAGDFDACWEGRGVDPDLLDPAARLQHRRAAQKAKYGGELFPADLAAEPGGTRFIDYFQRDRLTGAAKGIVAIDLGALA